MRIGHGSYSFLCIHCGYNFDDINEILSHIDYHFDILDNKIDAPLDGTNVFHDEPVSMGEDVDEYSIQKLREHQIENTANIQTDFKFEEDRETKTGLDELSLNVNIVDATKSAEVSTTKINRKKAKLTAKVKGKRKSEIPDDNNSCFICELTFNSSTDCKSHMRDVHQMLDRTFECYICGYVGKNLMEVEKF